MANERIRMPEANLRDYPTHSYFMLHSDWIINITVQFTAIGLRETVKSALNYNLEIHAWRQGQSQYDFICSDSNNAILHTTSRPVFFSVIRNRPLFGIHCVNFARKNIEKLIQWWKKNPLTFEKLRRMWDFFRLLFFTIFVHISNCWWIAKQQKAWTL